MTQLKNKLIRNIGLSMAASTVLATAGDTETVLEPAPEGNSGNWCDHLKDLGVLYKNKDNPYIQEIKFFGRAHYQWNHSEGDNFGIDFDGNGDQLRRLRFGTSVKFLNGFKAVGRVNVSEPRYRGVGIEYVNFDELYLEYGKKDFAGFDKASIGYGRYKVAIGGEEHTSSKKIKTVERSNINNFYAPARATGGRIKLTKGDVNYQFGVYTTDFDFETWAQWEGNQAFHATVEFEALNGEFIADFVYVDGDDNPNLDNFRYDWASSLAYTTEIGDVELFTNVVYGDTGNENVYGVVIMPSYEIIENKLEAVFRYQWAHSNGGGVIRPTGSRGVRAVAVNDGVPIARGDDDHTFYAGLNYFLCGHNAKLMVGVEYEDLSGPAVDLEATTVWGAFRMYF